MPAVREVEALKSMGMKRIAMGLCALLLCAGFFFGIPTGRGSGLSVRASAYSAPAFRGAAYHEDAAVDGGRVKIDTSGASEGYVAVSATSDRRLKFQVIKGEDTYTYDLPNDGTPGIFPLQSGDGSYFFRVMENVVDKKYSELYSLTVDVRLLDPYQPFLRPSTYISYTEESECVQKAAELAEPADDALGVVTAVYSFVCRQVTYDREKAATVKSGYLPDPDETMRTGKGICFDYAALAASMLRSQGIPTKMVFGYVSPNGLYHAWNMFYTEQTGWVRRFPRTDRMRVLSGTGATTPMCTFIERRKGKE